ncbi:hypothetical protein Rhopal_004262-T1 [Rhodotorula paludigena]|uniref:Trafficking protein particle complex subunit n=1 Tax=Rhodotorula paludigena TaxID=86838 RepID=A0AAV5GMT9_9BASI|nr:hypothetical protein Rhopal_004262-T1 [Rhodotorula paludigena]
MRPPPEPGPSTLPRVLPPSAAPTTASAPDDLSSTRPYSVPDALGVNGAAPGAPQPVADAKGKSRLAFDEEAKLVYGVVFSLRNMVAKLSSRGDESFHSVSTSAYKLHYLHTPTSFHFVLVTSPTPTSHRALLRQVYTGPFNEYVVRNPLASLDTQQGARGIDNAPFRRAVDKLLASI